MTTTPQAATAEPLHSGDYQAPVTLLPMGAPYDNDPNSQGFFPVGSECAKRVPRTHRAHL